MILSGNSKFNVGDVVKVKAAPASIYYPMNGLNVRILSVSIDINDSGNRELIYTFRHASIGFGALYESGLHQV